MNPDPRFGKRSWIWDIRLSLWTCTLPRSPWPYSSWALPLPLLIFLEIRFFGLLGLILVPSNPLNFCINGFALSASVPEIRSRILTKNGVFEQSPASKESDCELEFRLYNWSSSVEILSRSSSIKLFKLIYVMAMIFFCISADPFWYAVDNESIRSVPSIKNCPYW